MVAVMARERRDKVMRDGIVNELVITEIEQEPDAAACGFAGDRGQVVLSDQRARWIAWRVDDDAARARCDRIEQQIGGQLETVFRTRAHDDRCGFGELDL